MNIPTNDELNRLALDTPALHQALMLHRDGHCTFEEALRMAVAVLANQLGSANTERLEQFINAPRLLSPELIASLKQEAAARSKETGKESDDRAVVRAACYPPR